MNREALLLALSILVAAGAATLHLALLMRAVRSTASPAWLRALCLPLPPLAGYAAWRAGARALVYLWGLAWLLALALSTQLA